LAVEPSEGELSFRKGPVHDPVLFDGRARRVWAERCMYVVRSVRERRLSIDIGDDPQGDPVPDVMLAKSEAEMLTLMLVRTASRCFLTSIGFWNRNTW
jgi:hypothetical protein